MILDAKYTDVQASLKVALPFVDEFIHVLRGNLPRYEKPKPQTAEEVVEQAIQSAV